MSRFLWFIVYISCRYNPYEV